MKDYLKERKKDKNELSEWILDYDKNAYCDTKINNDTRDVLIDSFNECSDLRKSFHDSLQNFFNNLGFSASMKNIHKFDNSFTSFDNILHEKRKTFGYTEDFGLIKNNSVTKFGGKKSKLINLKQNQMKDHDKPITSIKKKMLQDRKLLDDDEKEEYDEQKEEKRRHDIDLINRMVYGDLGNEEN